MIENITREQVEALMQATIATANESTDQTAYTFNIMVDGEHVDILQMPAHLAAIYRSNPVFVEVTGNPIFD
jgi:hypothetical protein